jgi:hypothetical protein
MIRTYLKMSFEIEYHSGIENYARGLLIIQKDVSAFSL